MDILDFKAKVTGVQRVTLFNVQIHNRVNTENLSGAGQLAGSMDNSIFSFTCKAVQIPESTFGVIEVPYMGRKIKFNGDRSYQEWSTTVILDNEWEVYKIIYNWQERMNGITDNLADSEDMNMFKGVGIVTPLSNANIQRIAFTLHGLFPHSIQPLDMDWGTNDTVAELQVSWSFDYVTVGKPTTQL